MSADYQALMLFLVILSFMMYDLVFVYNLSISKIYFGLMAVGSLLVFVCLRFFELPDTQTAVIVVSFTAITGVYGGTADCMLRDFLQSRVMRFACLSHIGIWSGLIAWSTRWTF